MPKHRHPAAYRLLTYVTAEGDVEVIWNSRDGSAPREVPSAVTGEPATLQSSEQFHPYAPLYTPEVGERVFVDLTEVRARSLLSGVFDELERAAFEQLQAQYESRAAALDALAPRFVRHSGGDLLTVTAGWLEQLGESRRTLVIGVDVASPGWRPHDVQEARAVERKAEPEIVERSPYYDRQGRPISIEQMVELKKDDSYLRVALRTIGPYRVSTVWLGIDHAYGDEAPLIFETMVFDERITTGGNDVDGLTMRYHTEEDALKGHEIVCSAAALLRDELKKGNGGS